MVGHIFGGADGVLRQIPDLGFVRITPVIEAFATAGAEFTVFYHVYQNQRWIHTGIIGCMVHFSGATTYIKFLSFAPDILRKVASGIG